MNDIVRPDFDNMPIGKLREYAKHMQIPLAKTAKQEEIVDAIKRKLAGKTSAVISERGAKVPPGHAKIIINEDPTPGSKNFPVYFNINGYQCTIPRGKEVIVPMRVVRALQDAKVKRRTQVAIPDNYGREVFRNTALLPIKGGTTASGNDVKVISLSCPFYFKVKVLIFNNPMILVMFIDFFMNFMDNIFM